MKQPYPQDSNYTELSRELAELMDRLEQGDLDIDNAITCYERGLTIVNILENHLKKAENRVNILRSELDGSEEE